MPTPSSFLSETETAAAVEARRVTVRGLSSMVASCVMFSAMGAFVVHAQTREPAASSLVASFARIAINLLLLVGVAAGRGAVKELLGDKRPSLWWRGAFGSFALITSFASLKLIGFGEASFLLASVSVFVAAFAPLFLKQKNPRRVWIAIGGAMVGLFLLLEPRLGDAAPWGRALAVVSAMASALAYMMIARAGRSNSPESVIFYFCVVATLVHGVLFSFLEITWPVEVATWGFLAAAGVLGSLGQLFLTKAYQSAPAALNGAVAYLQPVLNMAVGIAVFEAHPDAKAFVGAAIVLAFGVALPFARLPKRA